ncbi:universal stress protein [Cellulophaga sp. F20128]|uniref:universal stress protein n=1 Tax=Cellulophaga sp. F20128 TaxID=2926413 RepID=UPI001FF4C0F7|nr:universal stress protein [Cellulophaga sp. F20128]MCK0158799.1 universal stress protein [Cellulophaga sp. F20128]
MKNILVPVGTSPESFKTLQYAVDFARNFSATIYVMEVFNVVSPRAGSLASATDKIEKNSREQLLAIINKVDAKGVAIKIATYQGDLIDGLKKIDLEYLGIDLIIIATRSNDINEENYLGDTSGKIIKRTDIPTLIVPKGYEYKPIKTILTAFKSGILKRKRILNPLIDIKKKYNSTIQLLLVKTPGYSDDDLRVNTALLDISTSMTMTDNPTTYLGVLEHLKTKHPDLLCVFRRKRGFFKKLWEKNTIAKSEFYAPIPVLVLSVKKD